ncbi:MAG: transposase family protein [Phenylobacterium sp.]|uniref:integrase catalytic domain-containing protein n=1 Tax=Phenylobacterium sp. TaxID=1871053 RepID=UPI00273778EF|nr:transposase family protein [Phenylobacterium sp.]MDP3745870.1 transposase family protein [Phenylobacterium sp.]MDZ4390712.1 transposase family protein [Gemmatimonadales bacterium]
MTISMQDNSLVSVAQLREFVKLSKGAVFQSTDRSEAYEWIGRTLGKFRYFSETKKNKGIIKRYIIMMTGYSETQIDRLIRRKKEIGLVIQRERTQPTFPRIYLPQDIALLAQVDAAEAYRNGKATKKTFADMYGVYGDVRFERLSKISVSHLYNLRGTRIYQSRSLHYEKTKPTPVAIGIRKKPDPEGKPGYLRVDSVHQGDRDKEKGVYHINLVDEVTQWEIVGCVEGISEQFLKPLLADALSQFPFVIRGFHSDNGSEYINKVAAKLLHTLLIEQTKSRSRHTNDNALVEGKNGAVIRRHMGYMHIPRKYAWLINEFYRTLFNSYLNFHRQCAFPEKDMDARGKIRITYNDYRTPCEKLLSFESVEKYLKPDITREALAEIQMKQSHLTAAKEMQEEKHRLFTKISNQMVH